jgi:prepilin-type N-terminal cleavage/methylation domain-containing protein
MTQRQRKHGARPAFTMIELLVVITIIAILIALLTGAVIRGLSKGAETQDVSEINELQAKLTNVMRNPNPVQYLPSRLHLSKTNNYTNTQLDTDTIKFLQLRFGKHTCCNFTPLPSAQFPTVPFIDWNGDGVANEELFLEGEQCLVFHLGGIPLTSSGSIIMTGFSNNAFNPAAPIVNSSEKRQGPYFEFQSARLKPMVSALTGNTANVTFPAYLDPWTRPGGARQPFAYFVSSNPEGVGQYDKYGAGGGSSNGSDCPSLIAPLGSPANSPLLPYIQTTSASGLANFVNPGTFQIISAGQDGKFGAGGTNWGRTGTTDQNGLDDLSNFSSHLLGTAP